MKKDAFSNKHNTNYTYMKKYKTIGE